MACGQLAAGHRCGAAQGADRSRGGPAATAAVERAGSWRVVAAVERAGNWPFKLIFSASCESVCSGTWDLPCFIEHVCISSLLD
ncbi:hypothetical protein PVAP13_5NG306481 [Panicum virgatum]|uniref:Uncharacterized protein n=1 Tax=Panicum virgatum TaxID=38727 RepID=A0A8T0RQX1_PANVG|nr:hypothetical protein PVAP13_5NG306481 [Panicum virgatum]